MLGKGEGATFRERVWGMLAGPPCGGEGRGGRERDEPVAERDASGCLSRVLKKLYRSYCPPKIKKKWITFFFAIQCASTRTNYILNTFTK